jgi:predicted GNAT family N-acyltransferase
MKITIVTASPEDIYDVRHRNLRQGQPKGTEKMPDIDNLATTVHFLAKNGSVTIGCATLMLENNQDSLWRLRGMAVDVEFRQHGIGRQLLSAMLQHGNVAEEGLWCNARTSARAFYEACGFVAEGKEFEIVPIGPHYVMRYNA